LAQRTDSGGAAVAQQYQSPEEQAAARALKEIADGKRGAVKAGLELGGGGDSLPAGAGAGGGAASNQMAAQAAAAGAQGGGAVVPGLGQQQDDQNKQGRKEQFLRMSDAASKTYLKKFKQAPISPFEIKAGWSIPSALECGLNSDLPGQTCARVTENVWDTATGRYLLIPQGTKVIGTYDSQIAYGQERILVVWNRLIFPDASSISLDGMPGEDKSGNAGFDADVNNHYGKVFGSALLMATFSSGIALSQKQSANANGTLSNSQTISQSVGQQLGQTGAAYIQKGMNIQPTLTRAPGYKFNIIVTRDILFQSAYRPL
jgi:type IV secretion system protein VirB10